MWFLGHDYLGTNEELEKTTIEQIKMIIIWIIKNDEN